MSIRCLSIPQQTLLGLQLLDELIVGGVGFHDDLINRFHLPVLWDLKSSILFADPVAPLAWRIVIEERAHVLSFRGALRGR